MTASRMIRICGLLAVGCFSLLAGRFWHPLYGFTKFIQLDEFDAQTAIREVKESAVFVYDGANGYDGAAYMQLAFHPALGSPELQPALGNVPYRARRILGSALAWVLAGGSADRIAGTYAALNIVVWLAFALLLWRVLPVEDWRGLVAWIGVMFSAGALHSVRLALTDLLAAAITTAAIFAFERGRRSVGVGSLAVAGLARETALVAVAAFWSERFRSARGWMRAIVITLAVSVPFLAWVVYIYFRVGPAAQGFGNFSWPIVDWIRKGADTIADFWRTPDFWVLNTGTLLAFVGLTAQAVFLGTRRLYQDSWWRMGICYVIMMAMLGVAVWEGHPGAATRVLLPMGVAFAVLCVRVKAGALWLLVGNLSVLSGVLALWHVPHDPKELASGRFRGGAYCARCDSGWYGVERHQSHSWAWSSGIARITINTMPRTSRPIALALRMRAVEPRAIQIKDTTTVLWTGQIGRDWQWVELAGKLNGQGRLVLHLTAEEAPRRENESPDARLLSFAVDRIAVKAGDP